MKYVFIINPAAGQGKGVDKLIDTIVETGKKLNKNFEIYTTKCIGDATEYIKNKGNPTSPTAYIACGGDGTFNEVVNGIYGIENTCAGVIPIGTGNDFCKNFEEHNFLEIEAQFNGTPIPCDVIEYSGIINSEHITAYCANMFNIGFDCNVADTTTTLKKYPLIKGSLAYFLSILAMLIQKKVQT